ncbi:hypothetical protein [Massilia aquatica]|uniref:Uncharacterized protein n=1 Tax=Massilia aquatica TaxID=2609000 RepID=A0ABX0MGX6_9BURK|nr:hypothetical protein [Massilia aquatica]NHZ43635.1 hypothetical protein [Massilia aquatica]
MLLTPENAPVTASVARRAFQALKGHNLIAHGGEKAVDRAYWSEVTNPSHPPGHGRTGNVKYLTPRQRRLHLTTFKDDHLVLSRASIFEIGINMTSRGEIIYVVDPLRNFYVGFKTIGTFHHSSFLAGAQVLAAGSMIIAPGMIIVEVNNHSGHYKPGLAQLKLAATVMKLKGANLNAISFKYSPPTGAPTTWESGVDMIRS